MTAELVRGQNHPLDEVRLEIRISAGKPIVAAATLNDGNGKVRGPEWVAHPGAPVLPGLEVSRQAAADHRLAVDLVAVPEAVHRVNVLLALPTAGAGPMRFGAVAAPFVAVTGLDGTEIASYTITGLDAESAVIARSSTAGRAPGRCAPSAMGTPAVSPSSSPTRNCPRPTTSQAPSTRRSPEGWPARLRPVRRVRRTPTAPGRRPHRPSARRAARRHRRPCTGPYRRSPCPPTAVRPPVPPGSRRRSRRLRTEAHRSRHTPDTARRPPHPAVDAQRRPGQLQPAAPAEPSPSAAPAGRSPAPPGQAAQPVAGDATGWSMDERLYNQVWGMLEDLARTTAAYRSAVDFAESRMEKELDQVLSDPRSRIGGQGEAAREAARVKHAQLVDQARAALDRDLAQLTAESEVVEPALPPAYVRWDNPVWHGYRVPMELPMAVRLGDLHLPESASLRIPMLVRLPLERGLWIDSGRSGSSDGSFADEGELRRLAMDTAVRTRPGCWPSTRRASSACTSSTRPDQERRRSSRWCRRACSRLRPRSAPRVSRTC